MTDTESMIPHIKRISKEKKKIKIPLLNVLLIFLGVFVLIWSTFVQLDITHPVLSMKLFSGQKLIKEDFFYTYSIIPQVPAVLFLAGMLGKRMGITGVILYILIGLFGLPVFALGGGPSYFGQAGFGYILGYVPAVYFAASILKEDFSFMNILKASLVGVLTIHFCGIAYMLVIALLKSYGWEYIKGWILSQSMLKLAYDYILSLVVLIAAKYGSKFVKFILA